MQVLVNCGKEDLPFMPQLAYALRKQGLSALSTSKDLELGQLLQKAKNSNCSAILLCNEQTLKHCVPGTNPTADNWRGSRLNFSVPVIVINKLAQLNTVPYGDWLLSKDLEKLQFLYKRLTPFTYTKLLEPKRFKEIKEHLSTAFCLYYDVETKTFPSIALLDSGGKEIEGAEEVGQTVITCASWTGIWESGKLETYMLPLIDYSGDHWDSNQDYGSALLFLKQTNALSNAKAMHNGMYDATHSLIYNAPVHNFIYDTMAMAHAEYAELPKDLAFVASYQLFDYINWKDDAEAASKSRDQEKYWAYNAKDTWNGARILVSQLRSAPDYAFTNYREKFQLVYPALYCNFEGLQIDQNKRILLRTEAQTRLKAAESSLRVKLADPSFNPGSWQQVEKYVYNVFGAKKPKIGKSKSCTDEKNLVAVGQQHPLLTRLTDDIISYRGDQKAIGTYYDYLQHKGRLLWGLNPFGTETERMACSASSLWCGTQVQNIPSYAKAMLVADPGYELFEADNSQSEGRTTAYCSQEENLIIALETAGRDFYKTLGTLFFNIPYEEVTKEFRNSVLKKIVHGTNYMMGGKTFIENIGVAILYKTAPQIGYSIVPIPRKGHSNEITLKNFAQLLLDVYHEPFPRIREWYQEIKEEVRTTGYSVSPLGHTRRCFGDISRDHSMLRSLVAHRPQNLSVTILNIGLNRVYRELVLPGNGDIRIKAQIHDSIFGQIRLGTKEYYAPRILDCMSNPVNIYGRILRIPVDIKFGHNWDEGSDKNPQGTFKWEPSKKEPT